ncbi:MAG: dockerin type I domain-containing protein [Planctomycetota bacterium]
MTRFPNRRLLHLGVAPLAVLAAPAASAALLGSYTFDTGATSAERLDSSGVASGLTLSSLGLGSNGTLEDAGVNALPGSTNDGFGFGGAGANQVMFWDRAANGVTSSWGTFATPGTSNPDGANTTVATADNIAGMNFTITADAGQIVTVEDVFISAPGSPDYLVAFQPAGDLGPDVNSADTSNDGADDARAAIGGPFVILPGQSQDFTIAWNSGGFNQRILLNQIDVNGSVAPAGSATSFTLIDDDFSSGGQGAWRERVFAVATADYTDDLELTPNPSGNAQPASAYQNFNDVTLQDGETIRLTVDASVSAGALDENSNVKIGLGFAEPRVGGNSSVISEALSGYAVSLGSNGGRVTDNPGTPEFDPDFIFPSLAFLEPSLANPDLNFFNLSPISNPEATALGFFDDNITNGQITLDQVATTLVFEATRAGSSLLISLTADGLLIDTISVIGADVIDNFTFNTIGLSHAFEDGQTATFDNVLVEYVLASVALPGDANSDGVVDLLDFDVLAQNFGSSTGNGAADGDFNGDGAVDLLDFDILAQNFGATSPGSVPEPASLGLIALGGAALLRRRRA